MYFESGTTEGSVGVSKSKLPVKLQNEKGWQPSSESSNSDFCLYERAFPKT